MTDLRYDLRHIPTNDDWHRSYDEKRCTSAAIGSEQLRDACLRLFWKFELQNRLPCGYGMAIQHKGYRS